MQSLRITFAGLFANNFLPSTVGGDVARLAGSIQVGFDAGISAASLIADRLIGLLGFAFTLPIGLQYFTAANLHTGAALPAALLTTQSGWRNRVAGWLRKFWASLLKAVKLWASQPRALFMALLFTFVHMACLFSTIYIFLDGMHDALPFWSVAGLQSLVYVVTLIPISISGWGVQEFSISYAFSVLGGVAPADSLVLALLIRTLFILASLPGALFISDVLPGMAKAQPLINKADG